MVALLPVVTATLLTVCPWPFVPVVVTVRVFPVCRDRGTLRRRDLAALLVDRLNRIRVDPCPSGHIGVGIGASDAVILPVVIRCELPVNRFAIRRDLVNGDLDAGAGRFNTLLSRFSVPVPGCKLDFARVEFPQTDLWIAAPPREHGGSEDGQRTHDRDGKTSPRVSVTSRPLTVPKMGERLPSGDDDEVTTSSGETICDLEMGERDY